MNTRKSMLWLLGAAIVGFAAYKGGLTEKLQHTATAPAAAPSESTVKAPAVSVVRVQQSDFAETVLVTGSLVPREEIMVAPQVEGLKVMKINADQGDRVKKGDVLAVLVSETLDAQMAQNDASLARSSAAIAQANSQIVEAEARLKEAKNSLERAKPLNKNGYLSGSTFDQRESAARTTEAQLAAARDGLKSAQAGKAEVEAQRRELSFRRDNAEVKAPANGLISRRGARLGSIATGAIAGAGEPMFRIIQNGEIELDAEVTEAQIPKLRDGQVAIVKLAGGVEATGKLRLISPEIDPATRLGRVRIFLGDNAALKVGAFGSGMIQTATSHGLALPVTALSTAAGESTVLAVNGQKVERRVVTTGLSVAGLVEIKSGLADGDTVIARAGSFLRDGDTVRPLLEEKVEPAGTASSGTLSTGSVSEIQ
jgi:HlyD family secretion protein